MEFQDSEVTDIRIDADVVVVKFSAASVHRGGAEQGFDAVAGYAQGIELVCNGAVVLHHDDGCIGRISDGCLIVGERKMKTMRIPGGVATALTLELHFTNGSRFGARAAAAAMHAVGDARFVESFKC